jgi:alpha-glucosidase/lysosomal alpha-glucosidase
VNSKFSLDEFNTIQNDLKTRYVPLLDVAVGIKYGDEDEAFREGCEMDVFCRSPQTGLQFRGYVWPGYAYFPDFFHPNASSYWSKMIKLLYTQAPFDGIWIDMNEPTNFCDGECRTEINFTIADNTSEYFSHPLSLPYLPGNVKLETKSLRKNKF